MSNTDDQKPKFTVIDGDGNEIELVDEDEFTQLVDAWQHDMLQEQLEIKDKFRVSLDTASAIQYIRTRSRYTPEKELQLIAADHAGEPIPLSDVLSGEF